MQLMISDPVLTAICRNFSSSSNNTEWEVFVEENMNEFYTFSDSLFYANGNCEENEGYVSIVLCQKVKIEQYETCRNAEIHCCVSVVDVTRNKRFMRSAVCVYDSIKPHLLEEGLIVDLGRYLKRDTLLNDPAELLPGDCLTVCVEINLIYHFNDLLSQEEVYTENPLYRDENGLWICLDTGFAKDLCRVSNYFRCASDSPMIEGKTRKVRIQEKEEHLFWKIYEIFEGFGDMWFSSIEDIFELYHAAYKYDIQLLIETCRQFVKAILRSVQNSKYREYSDECIPGILELADFYKDDETKVIVEIYLKSKENFGKDDYALGQYLREKIYTDWICEFILDIIDISRPPVIRMRRRRIERPKFEF